MRLQPFINIIEKWRKRCEDLSFILETMKVESVEYQIISREKYVLEKSISELLDLLLEEVTKGTRHD